MCHGAQVGSCPRATRSYVGSARISGLSDQRLMMDKCICPGGGVFIFLFVSMSGFRMVCWFAGGWFGPPSGKKKGGREPNLVWSGLAWFGLAWFGKRKRGVANQTWFGLVWPGLVWPGLVWFADRFANQLGVVCSLVRGLVGGLVCWFGLVWFGGLDRFGALV